MDKSSLLNKCPLKIGKIPSLTKAVYSFISFAFCAKPYQESLIEDIPKPTIKSVLLAV